MTKREKELFRALHGAYMALSDMNTCYRVGGHRRPSEKSHKALKEFKAVRVEIEEMLSCKDVADV